MDPPREAHGPRPGLDPEESLRHVQPTSAVGAEAGRDHREKETSSARIPHGTMRSPRLHARPVDPRARTEASATAPRRQPSTWPATPARARSAQAPWGSPERLGAVAHEAAVGRPRPRPSARAGSLESRGGLDPPGGRPRTVGARHRERVLLALVVEVDSTLAVLDSCATLPCSKPWRPRSISSFCTTSRIRWSLSSNWRSCRAPPSASGPHLREEVPRRERLREGKRLRKRGGATSHRPRSYGASRF